LKARFGVRNHWYEKGPSLSSLSWASKKALVWGLQGGEAPLVFANAGRADYESVSSRLALDDRVPNQSIRQITIFLY
jgi:hypothetical protein